VYSAVLPREEGGFRGGGSTRKYFVYSAWQAPCVAASATLVMTDVGPRRRNAALLGPAQRTRRRRVPQVPPSILRGGNSRRRAGVPLKRVDALEIQLGRQTSQPSPLQERDFLADGRLVPVISSQTAALFPLVISSLRSSPRNVSGDQSRKPTPRQIPCRTPCAVTNNDSCHEVPENSSSHTLTASKWLSASTSAISSTIGRPAS